MKPSVICLHIYSLTSFAFLEYQTSGFYHTSEANLVPLLIFIAQIHIASFTSMFFSVKYLTGCQGAQWLNGRVLDSRPKGRGFEPQRRHCVVVLEQDTFILA